MGKEEDKKLVLWIDDEPASLKFHIKKLREMLKKNGYELIFEENVSDAFKTIERRGKYIALLFIDLMLPIDDKTRRLLDRDVRAFDVGVETIKILKEKFPEIPIVVFTQISPETETGKKCIEEVRSLGLSDENIWFKSDYPLGKFIKKVKDTLGIKGQDNTGGEFQNV